MRSGLGFLLPTPSNHQITSGNCWREESPQAATSLLLPPGCTETDEFIYFFPSFLVLQHSDLLDSPAATLQTPSPPHWWFLSADLTSHCSIPERGEPLQPLQLIKHCSKT